MNRKQKIAVVVGVVVIALLVLFPPWELDEASGDPVIDAWSFQYGPAWVGCPPQSPMARIHETTREALRTLDPDRYESLKHYDPGYPPVTINWAQLIAHVAATLALTVAAVVVLKELKA